MIMKRDGYGNGWLWQGIYWNQTETEIALSILSIVLILWNSELELQNSIPL